MRGWLQQTFVPSPKQVVAQLMVTAIIAGGLTVWGWLDGVWSGPELGFVALMAVAFTLVAINQFNAVFERQSRKLSDEKLATLLRDWMFARGFTVRDDPQEAALFQFVVEDSMTRKVVVGRLRDDPNILHLGAQVELTPEQREAVRAMPEGDRESLVMGLAVELSRYGIESAIQAGQVGPIRLTDKTLVPDKVDEQSFVHRVWFVRRAVFLVVALLQQRLSSWMPA